jgi:hypothetical protein
VADREYGTAAALHQGNTANTNPTTYFSLTHTPAAGATYLYLLDIWATMPSRSVSAIVDVDDGANLWVQQRWRQDGAEQGGTRSLAHAFLVTYGASPGPRTFAVRYYLSATGATLTVQQGRLTYLRLGANDRFASNLPASASTTAATWTTRQSLTLAAGEYLLLASASVAMLTGTTALSGADIRASAGATRFGDCSPYRNQTPGTQNYLGWRAALDYTAAAGDAFTVDYAADAGSGAAVAVRDVALCALWVPDLPVLYKAEQTAEISTSATAPQAANTLSFTAVAADHLLIETAYPRQTVTGAAQLAEEVALTKGGAAYDQATLANQTAGSSSAYQIHARAMVETLPAGAVSYVTTYRATGGALTAYVKGRRLYAIQLTGSARAAYVGVGVEVGVVPTVAGLGGLAYRAAGAEAGAAPAVVGAATVGRAQGVGGTESTALAVAGSSSIQRINTATVALSLAVSGSATVAAAAVSGRGVQAVWADEATRSRGARPVFFFFADFGAAGVFRCWTGFTNRVWDGVTWYAAGDLLSVTAPKETATRERTGVTVRLASRDQFQVRDHLAEALSADIHGNKARIYLGWLLDDGTLAGDPVAEFDGELGSITIGGQPDGSLYVDVGADHETRDLDRGQRYRITAASQAAIDPNDKGLEYLADMSSIKVLWGQRYYASTPSGP